MAKYSKSKMSHIQSTMLGHIRKYVDGKARLVSGGVIRYRIWNGKDTIYKYNRRVKVLAMQHFSVEQQVTAFEELYCD